MDKEFQNKFNQKMSFPRSRNELPKRSRETLIEHKPKLRNVKGNKKGFSKYLDSRKFPLVRSALWMRRPLNLLRGNVE